MENVNSDWLDADIEANRIERALDPVRKAESIYEIERYAREIADKQASLEEMLAQIIEHQEWQKEAELTALHVRSDQKSLLASIKTLMWALVGAIFFVLFLLFAK